MFGVAILSAFLIKYIPHLAMSDIGRKVKANRETLLEGMFVFNI